MSTTRLDQTEIFSRSTSRRSQSKEWLFVWRPFARLWPLAMIFLGVVLSFGWAVLLIWLIVCAVGSLV